MKNEKKYTEIWQKYEKCKEYLDGKGIVAKTNRNWNFFIGRQWEGCNTGGQELPMLNFIKPIVQYKVSTVAQNAMTAIYSDMNADPSMQEIYDKLNKYWQQCWEKAKMNQSAWKVLKSGAIQGDTYVYWQDGDTLQPPMIIDNSCVYLSNENIDNIQEQEFIIVRERWTLESVKKYAEEQGISKDEIKKIMTDNDTETQLFNKKEVEDKVTVLFYMTKKDGIVHTGRATKEIVIEKIEPIRATKDGIMPP